MKKILSVSLAILLLVTSLVGCSKKADNTGATTSPTKAAVADSSTGSDAQPSGEKTKLTALVVTSSLTKDVNTLQFLKTIADAANVTIEWTQVKSGWEDKKSAMLSSGDIPDLIIGGWAINDNDFVTYTGLFEPLNNHIGENTPNIQKMFSDMPELKTMSTMPDGNIYGLPKYQRFWPRSGNHQLINKQWLDKLGLSVPTNWDELYNVLVAFKTEDPNGNGIADEVPMDWAPTTGSFNAINLIAGYGITANFLNGSGYYVDNGVVKNYYIDDHFKDVMKFLNKCLNEGLINNEVFTQDYIKFQALSRGAGDSTAIVGFTYGWDAPDRMGQALADQYVSVAPLKPSASYTGPVSWDYEYNDINYGIDYIEMSANCKNKDAAMAFIDQFYDPVNSIQVLFGSMGECIKDNGDGSYTVLPPPEDSKLDPGTWKRTNALADAGPMYISKDINLDLPTDMLAILDMESVYFDALDKVDTENGIWPGAFIKYSVDDNNNLAIINTDLNSIFTANYSKWVTEGTVDADWDAYLSNVKKAGLDDALQVMQKYYDAYQASK